MSEGAHWSIVSTEPTGAYCRDTHRLVSPLFQSRSGHKGRHGRSVQHHQLARPSMAFVGVFLISLISVATVIGYRNSQFCLSPQAL